MLVLGIDPSLRSTGYALVRGDRNRQQAVDYGLITTRASQTLEEALLKICGDIEAFIARTSPDCLAIEDIFSGRNSRVALLLGQVRGAVIHTCCRAGLEVFHYPPARIKETVSGYGAAGKEQIQTMVKMTLSLPETPPSDAADALAAALTHLAWEGGRRVGR